MIMPFQGFPNTLCRIISAGQYIFMPIVCSIVIQTSEKSMVLWSIDMRNLSLEKGKLQVFHFLPVDNLCIQIQAKTIYQFLYIINSFLGIPACVNMKENRS